MERTKQFLFWQKIITFYDVPIPILHNSPEKARLFSSGGEFRLNRFLYLDLTALAPG